jgi:hypothetical protein
MPEVCARTEIGSQGIERSKFNAGTGTEDLFFRNIVHIDRDAKHGCQRDQILAEITVPECPVISPQVFIILEIMERSASGQPRQEPRRGACRIGTFVEHLVNFPRERCGPPFSKLEHRSKPLHYMGVRMWYKKGRDA